MKNKIGKLDNDSFADAFFRGALKRKKDYGNLYVIDGPNCSVLMNRSKRVGEIILAIKFNNINLSLINNSTPSRAYSLGDVSAPFNFFKTNLTALQNKTDITKLKLVDWDEINKNSCLFSVEEVKFLIHDDIEKAEVINKEDFLCGIRTNADTMIAKPNRNKKLYRIKCNVNTVKEAKLKLLPEESEGLENVRFYRSIWILPEDNFNPEIFLNSKILSNPPSPTAYGLTREFKDYSSLEDDLPDITAKNNLSKDIVEKIEKYIVACKSYAEAETSNNDPVSVKGLSGLRISSYENIEAGLCSDEYDNVFVKGKVYDMTDSYGGGNPISLTCHPRYGNYGTEVIKLPTWHKFVPLESI